MTTKEEKLLQLRQRLVVEFYDGTSPAAGHWMSCRVCGWVWRYEDGELHAPDCALEAAIPLEVLNEQH